MENPLDEHLTKDPVIAPQRYPPITIQFVGAWLFHLIAIIICIGGAQSLLGFVHLSTSNFSPIIHSVVISGYVISTSVLILHFLIPVFHIQREYFKGELRESIPFATAIFAIPLSLIVFFCFSLF